MEPVHKIIYKSAKGENFTPIYRWIEQNLTPEEFEHFTELDHTHPDYIKIYKRWAEEEQIIRHIYMIDDEVIYDNPVIL